MPTRAERSAQTRSELLHAAEQRFFVHGYHGTTLDDIADDAGYTKGAVYSTFKSKAGLFLALFDEVAERRLAELREMLAPHDDDEARFRALGSRPADDRNTQFLLLAIEFWTHAAREPAVLGEFSARYRRFRDGLAELGPRDSVLGSERWAMVTLALANGLALERLIDPEGVPSDLLGVVQSQIARR
ncbi:MAG TPA: TetR family transcriptional regulator [Solirubrobacteraceae bacterium]|nr:TetR family transcriptional regulator [Solirubrobacteraceae bacterium]